MGNEESQARVLEYHRGDRGGLAMAQRTTVTELIEDEKDLLPEKPADTLTPGSPEAMLDAFFKQLDREGQYSMTVDYLPLYSIDGRVGTGKGAAEKVFVARIRNLTVEDL